MYIAVLMYREGTPLGIIFGIPLFIFCGFQHCITIVITLGVTCSFHWYLLICIVGHFAGSLFMWYISKNEKADHKKRRNKLLYLVCSRYFLLIFLPFFVIITAIVGDIMEQYQEIERSIIKKY